MLHFVEYHIYIYWNITQKKGFSARSYPQMLTIVSTHNCIGGLTNDIDFKLQKAWYVQLKLWFILASFMLRQNLRLYSAT